MTFVITLKSYPCITLMVCNLIDSFLSLWFWARQHMTCANFVFDVDKFPRLICHCLIVIAAVAGTCGFARCTTQKRKHEQQTFTALWLSHQGHLSYKIWVHQHSSSCMCLLAPHLPTFCSFSYSQPCDSCPPSDRFQFNFTLRSPVFGHLDNICIRTFLWKKRATHMSSQLSEKFKNTKQQTFRH